MSASYKNSYEASNKELLSLFVNNVGYEQCAPDYQWGPGIRDHYLIHHIISGCGYYERNQTLYKLSAGDTFLIYPYEEVTYYADHDDPWEYCWVGFRGTDAKNILLSTHFSPSSPVLYAENEKLPIKKHLLQIYDARGSEFKNAVQMTGLLYSALALFMQDCAEQNENKCYKNYAKKGMEYIHDNYQYPLSVEDVAKYVGISRSHLYRSFEETLSLSPKEYLTSFRIQQACILLKQSHLSIAVIGRSVGFLDNLNFSKAFKKAKGMSPLAYAKSKNQSNRS